MTTDRNAAKSWEHSTGCAIFDEKSTEPCNCKSDAASVSDKWREALKPLVGKRVEEVTAWSTSRPLASVVAWSRRSEGYIVAADRSDAAIRREQR